MGKNINDLKGIYSMLGGNNVMDFSEFKDKFEEDYNNQEFINDRHVPVFFISGHRDITQAEFDEYYKTAIDKVIMLYDNCEFVVGDYHGVDIMAQQYLKIKDIENKRITVYHMFDKPRNLATSEFNIKGGYKSDEERDAAMTNASDFDIAWFRKGKENSGTAQNIMRRHRMN